MCKDEETRKWGKGFRGRSCADVFISARNPISHSIVIYYGVCPPSLAGDRAKKDKFHIIGDSILGIRTDLILLLQWFMMDYALPDLDSSRIILVPIQLIGPYGTIYLRRIHLLTIDILNKYYAWFNIVSIASIRIKVDEEDLGEIYIAEPAKIRKGDTMCKGKLKNLP